jgi:hypothetical protein
MELSCLFSPDKLEFLCPSSQVLAGFRFNRVRSFEDNIPLFIIHLELARAWSIPSIYLLKEIYYYLSSKDPLLASM